MVNNLINLLSVAIGGALGAVLRYSINNSPLANSFEKFPFHTFAINIAGSFLIGLFFVFLAEKTSINESLRNAIMVGFIGAFTTFSTFELEIFILVREKFFVMALVYVLLSVITGFIGVWGGIWLAEKI